MTTADTIRLEQLDARIRSVWLRGQTLHLVSGVLAFLRWAIPLFLLSMWIDWMTYMPAGGRVVLLAALISVSLLRAWRGGWCRVRPFNAVRTALQLETRYADLNSLLVSAIQLRDHATAGGGSIALRDRTCRLAEEAAAGLRPKQAVPYQPLHRPALVAALMLGVIGGFALVKGPFLYAGVVRIWMPWVAIDYPTDTQITLGQGELVIKEGDSATISARLHGIVPDQATIFVRTGEGKARAIDLTVKGDACEYNIVSASRDFSYRIKAGDDRTPWHTVRVVPAPRFERVRVQQRFPEYLGLQPQTVEALTLAVPESTIVNWQLTLDRPIRAARFIRDDHPAIDLPISADGRVVSLSETVTASRGYNFVWVDRDHGFSFASPRYYLQVSSDQAPRVELTTPSANMVAMLGRPLKLTARAQDDHGLASTAIAYRVNQRDEVAVVLPEPIQAGQGDQPIEWDYRAALPDLAIGDSVSFTLEVSDRYPGPQGPHTVRSESRRVTFLSKAQYLEQIEKQKDRLLSRVQTIYRQQRSAHETVRTLVPGDAGYLQACQMEAIRQEMVREQLKETASQLQALLDDLAANGVSDAASADSLDQVRRSLHDIAENHIARAAALLRDQSGGAQAQPSAADPGRAAQAVNNAARQLGRIVMLRGIESAQEVYARETRMLAQAQASLRWSAVMSGSADAANRLAAAQDELAGWTEQLIADLQAGMRYDKRPLAVMRLTRSVKDLRDAGASAAMREAGDAIRQGKTEHASTLQAQLVRTLLDAEFSVRLSGAYSTLLQTRRQIGSLADAQARLSRQSAAVSPDDFTQQRSALLASQASLRKALLTLMLPSVPAPRAQLFDESLPPPPPVQDLLAQADRAMAEALIHLTAGKTSDAAAQQRLAEQALGELTVIVDRWAAQVGLESQGMSTLVAATSERMARLEEYEARTVGLLEKTDIAAAEDQKVDRFAETQLILADELKGFIRDLKKQNQAEPDADLPPVLGRLELAERALNTAVQPLEANNADDAITQQERAADALAEAYTIVLAQNKRLAMLQDLLMFQRSVGFASGYMADIVAEQRDLLAETRSLEPDAMAALLPRAGNMRDCLVDVAPLLDLVAARLDVGTPLVFAKTDFEDAIASMQSGDKFDAVDAQDVAAESLASVQVLVQEVRAQTGTVAEIVALLHTSVSESALMQARQQELSALLESAPPNDLPRIAQAQQALLDQAERLGQQLERATGMTDFNSAAQAMRLALTHLQANDPASATGPMRQAVDVLAGNQESLLAMITMLHGLPSIEISNQSAPELVRLVDALALASRHKAVFRATTAATPDEMEALAKQQRELAELGQALAKAGPQHAMLDAAREQLASAVTAFDSSDRTALRASQRAADAKLRHFIIEQALILETAVPPPAASDGSPTDDGPGSDSESEFAAGFISDFVSGEVPQDKRTEWKVLADRNRAALNQNFARELPLEYRGLLKDYYERVAE